MADTVRPISRIVLGNHCFVLYLVLVVLFTNSSDFTTTKCIAWKALLPQKKKNFFTVNILLILNTNGVVWVMLLPAFFHSSSSNSLWRKAAIRNFSFAISFYGGNLIFYQFVWYQRFVIHFPKDTTPYLLTNQTSHYFLNSQLVWSLNKLGR